MMINRGKREIEDVLSVYNYKGFWHEGGGVNKWNKNIGYFNKEEREEKKKEYFFSSTNVSSTLTPLVTHNIGSILPLETLQTLIGEREWGARNNNRESSEANNEKKRRRERGLKGVSSSFSCVNTASDVLFPRARARAAECCCRTIYQTERERFSLDWLCVCFPLFFLFSSSLEGEVPFFFVTRWWHVGKDIYSLLFVICGRTSLSFL